MWMLAQPNPALTHRFPVFSNTQEKSATIHDTNHKLLFMDHYERRLALHQTNSSDKPLYVQTCCMMGANTPATSISSYFYSQLVSLNIFHSDTHSLG